MEGAVLSVSNSNNRFRTHLKNAASAICARTLPKQRRSEGASHGASSSARHHTYPRAAPPKRASIPCRLEPLVNSTPAPVPDPPQPEPVHLEHMEVQQPNVPNGTVTLRGTLAREVANAWESRVGPPDEPASADRVQSLFNDIELYPTKTQVFEMLVCARQCARRKSLTLTFGEFCVFAAELRRCSRQARQPSSKPESPVWNIDKELKEKDSICKHVNGSEASPPPEVFLGGSCNPTTWRADIAIPMLKKMGISYFNPQVEDWSTELMEVEHRAKAAARALLFVLDSETRAVAACVEAAHLAAAPKDLLLVLRPYSRRQTIGHETISNHEYLELSRARATLQEAVERRGLPAFTDIPAALRCARAVLRGARTHPRHSLGHTILRLKRTFDAAGGRAGCLPRARAVDTLRDVTRAPRDRADRCVPPGTEVDFETFCAAVAELAADAGPEPEPPPAPFVSPADACAGAWVAARMRRAFRSLRLLFAPENVPRNGQEISDAGNLTTTREGGERTPDAPREGALRYNARLRAYGRKLGLFIPKNGGNRVPENVTLGTGESESSIFTPGTDRVTPGTERVFTPGTERRLERLPAMLGAPTHDVYLAGSFPSNCPRPEEILKRESLTYVIPRTNDYTRMFSTAARRAAPAHPESPRRDKKPRPEPLPDEDVQLREKTPNAERADRLSASDFYTVTEDVTPQPFKGTYDEDLVLGSRVLVFSLSSEAPCFAAMVLAAHYMGLRPAATVLLVQPMDPSKATNYSEAAVKDYNRGRHYLSDLARRSGVPVFDDVTSTMDYVVNRLRTNL